MSNQYETVRSLRATFDKGVSYRFNCPFCHGNNTLGVARLNSKLVWNCFKASCKVHGRHDETPTVKELQTQEQIIKSDGPFIPPERWLSPIWEPEAIKFLEKYHCIRAFTDGAVDLKYDPLFNRIVFPILDRQFHLVDAIGRALTQDIKPKWYKYAKTGYPFICNRSSDYAVVVEDATSAAALYPIATGVAMLGTNLTMATINELRGKLQIIVALDPDAQKTAIDIRAKLSYIYDNVKLVMIPDDLKYYNLETIASILEIPLK